MADVCSDISRLAKDIRDLLRKAGEATTWEEILPDGSRVTRWRRLNQTAALDGNKITDIKTSVGAYHRTPKGKAVIYTGDPAYPTLEPNSRDVREMIEHERPFMCRAVTAFGRPQAVCFEPGDNLYRFIKEDIERTEELTESLKGEITRVWGEYDPKKLSLAEEAFIREFSKREHILDDILDGLAGKVLKACKVSL